MGVSSAAIGEAINTEGALCCGYVFKYAHEENVERFVRQYPIKGGKFIREFKSSGAAAKSKHLGIITKGGIANACTGRAHTAGGYQWRYATDNIESLPPVKKKKRVVQKRVAFNKEEYIKSMSALLEVLKKSLPETSDKQAFTCEEAEKKFVRFYTKLQDTTKEELDKWKKSTKNF